jgi:hypothetical protein
MSADNNAAGNDAVALHEDGIADHGNSVQMNLNSAGG